MFSIFIERNLLAYGPKIHSPPIKSIKDKSEIEKIIIISPCSLIASGKHKPIPDGEGALACPRWRELAPVDAPPYDLSPGGAGHAKHASVVEGE